MTTQGSFDVRLAAPTNPDGTRNFFNSFQMHYVLLSNIVGEMVDRVGNGILSSFPH